jgi:hypothetical protein
MCAVLAGAAEFAASVEYYEIQRGEVEAVLCAGKSSGEARMSMISVAGGPSGAAHRCCESAAGAGSGVGYQSKIQPIPRSKIPNTGSGVWSPFVVPPIVRA